MILTTTHNIEGKPIREYLGIVTGEAIMGANIVRDFFATVTDIVGGRYYVAVVLSLHPAWRGRLAKGCGGTFLAIKNAMSQYGNI